MLTSGQEALRDFDRMDRRRRRRAIGLHDDARHPHMSSLHDPWQDVGGWTPARLPGLVLWLRADLGVTLSDGNVSEWADQSGNENNFSGSAVLVEDSINGQPALTLSNGYSLAAGSALAGLSGATAVERTIVVSFASSGNGDLNIGNGWSNTPDNYDWYSYSGSNYDGLGCNTRSNAAFAVSTDTPYAYNTRSSGSGFSTYFNGVASISSDYTCEGMAQAPSLGIDIVGGYPYTYVAEVILTNGLVSTADRSLLQAYIQSRYGIAA